MAGLVLRKCPCLRPKIEEEVRVLDYRHSSLHDVPGDVFNFERTLEELYTDSNQIRDLPRELFYCHGLRKLSISDNEITSIPPAIASLDHLEELDFSKNGIIDVPDNIKCCKYLRSIDASVNPLGKLPEGFTQLQNLTHLFLNDTFLDYLPGSFGRLVKLKILEIRENHLKTLPKSFGRLTELERLDIGNNEFTELPDVIGSLTSLLELWCDNNQLTSITHTIGALKQLMFLDASKNQLESLPGEIEGCTCLADLHLSTNQLMTLPDAIGNLSNLTTLKADDNQLTSLPKTLGGLASLSELNVSVNDLEELPASIGLLRNLRTFYADENLLTYVPAELGSCSGITVLSLRSNKLTYIPDELGRIPRLRVMNLSDNRLSYLPFTIVKLKELQALWLTENQTRPLIPLQSDYEADTGRKILTCYLLPQGQNSDEENGGEGDDDSFHASIWDEERQRRQQIHFNFIDDEEDEGHLVRCPTPYPKEMREKARHMRNLAMRQTMGEDDSAAPAGTSTGSRSAGPENGQGSQAEGKSNFAYGPGEDTIDVRVRDTRSGQSPSLQETHRLYRYDKEKLLKDKARMQHRHSMPDIPDSLAPPSSSSNTGTPRSVKRGKSQDSQPLLESDGGGGGGGGSNGRKAKERSKGSRKHAAKPFLGVASSGDSSRKARERNTGRRKDVGLTEFEESPALEEPSLCNGARTSAYSDTEDVRVTGRRKSTPNLFSFDGGGEGGSASQAATAATAPPKRTPSFTYEDIYQRQLSHRTHHHHHHGSGRRSRRMRDYDSDTGGARSGSDHEGLPFQRQSQFDDISSVRSQPTMPSSGHRKSHRRGGGGRDRGYASDLEAYAGRGRGVWGGGGGGGGGVGGGGGAMTPSLTRSKPSMYALQSSHSLPQDLNSATPTRPPHDLASLPHPSSSSAGQYSFGGASPSLSRLTTTPSNGSSHHHHGGGGGPGSSRHGYQPRPGGGGGNQHHHPGAPPSPSQFNSSTMLDQSTPLATQPPQGFPLPSSSSTTPSSQGYPPSASSQGFPPQSSSKGYNPAFASSQGFPPGFQPGPAGYNPASQLQGFPSSAGAPQPGSGGGGGGSGTLQGSPSSPQKNGGGGGRVKEREVHRELYTVLEERNRKMSTAVQDARPSPTPSLARSGTGSKGQTPPPYQPAPPYHRHSDRAADQSHDISVQNSPRDGATHRGTSSSFSNPKGGGGGGGGSSFSNPEYASVQYRNNNRADRAEGLGSGQRHEYETVAAVHCGADGQYSSGQQQQQQLQQQHHHQQQQQQQRTSGGGGGGGGGGGDQGYSGEGVRTRDGASRDSPAAMQPVGVVGGSVNRHEAGADHYGVGGVSRGKEGERGRAGGGGGGGGAGSHIQYTSSSSSYNAPHHHPSNTPSSLYGAAADRSRDNLTPVNPHRSHLDGGARHSPSILDRSPSTASRPRSGSSRENILDTSARHSPHTLDVSRPRSGSSRENVLDNGARHSPHTLDVSSSSAARPRSASRENVLEGRPDEGSLTPGKGFEVYPNPYGEPLEAGDPLMKRYEDVARFKARQQEAEQDPSSQVSSSTDSGYGHGHHIYERIGDFNARRAGSPHSSTPPSQRNTPVQRHNSSSQGTPSRETTPVKEEGFYSVQGNILSESTTQESREVFRTVIRKNPGLGFSIAGGQGSRGYNPYRTGDNGIFVTKVQQGGPAAAIIQAGDKILQVNHIDFRSIDHSQAVNVMKTAVTVELLVERVQKINMV